MRELHLPDGNTIQLGRIPDAHCWDDSVFSACWDLHPQDRHIVKMFGRSTPVARWQQSYGADYQYTGSRNNALPIPDVLRPQLTWAREMVDERLNGLLLNWYDGPTSYIGPHRDSRAGVLVDTPIVTVSFGETRTFRLEQGKGVERRVVDIAVSHGDVVVMPEVVNQMWKHSIPARAGYVGRRISVTIRAFSFAKYE